MAQCYDPRLLRLNLIDIAFGLATSLSMAFFTLLGKRMAGDYSPWTIIFYGLAFGALFLLAFRLPHGAGLLSLAVNRQSRRRRTLKRP